MRLPYGLRSRVRRDSPIGSIVDNSALSKHALLVDQALDRVLATDIKKERGISFFGIGMASGESTRESRRFCAFSLQVTQVYIPWIPDPLTWSAWNSPPIRVQKRLVDIVHCPHKDGGPLAKAMQLQMQTLGLALHDIHSGTGDGGGRWRGTEEFTRFWKV